MKTIKTISHSPRPAHLCLGMHMIASKLHYLWHVNYPLLGVGASSVSEQPGCKVSATVMSSAVSKHRSLRVPDQCMSQQPALCYVTQGHITQVGLP